VISPGCQEYFEQLKRHFGWLFDEYGFSLLHSLGDSGYYCEFILQSGDCRFRIDVQRGRYSSMELAMVPAPLKAEVFIRGLKWYPVAEVVNFLEKRSPDYEQVEERSQYLMSLTHDGALAALAEEYRPAWSQIMELFQEDEFERRQDEFEQFRQEYREERGKQHLDWVRRHQLGPR
jgi:hypothetical protein